MQKTIGKHAPHREMVNATSPSSRPNVFSESSVADAFVAKFQHRIIRFDPDPNDDDYSPDDEPSFLVINICKRDTVGVVEILSHGGHVPDAFVLQKVRELVAQLTAGADELTVVRCNSFAFCAGVFAFLKSDPRLADIPHKKPVRGFDYERLSSIMEKPRAHAATG
jgi:hypothetical protein